MFSLSQLARDYIARGWKPIPIPAKSKAPKLPGWQDLRLTAADVRDVVEIPPGLSPKVFGAVPTALAKAGIIYADGFAKTCRPLAHARPLTVWRLADRAKAEAWLADHPLRE